MCILMSRPRSCLTNSSPFALIIAPMKRTPVTSPLTAILPLFSGLSQLGEIFGHVGGANQISIVTESDDRLAIRRPKHPVFVCFFFGVLGKLRKMRRKIRHEQFAIAHHHQRRRGGLDQVGDIALGLRLAEKPAREIRRTGAIGFHFDARIFGLEHIGDVAVRGEARVPHELAFLFRPGLEHLFSIRAAIVGEIGDRLRLRASRRGCTK